MSEEEDKKTKKVEVDSPTLEQQAVDSARQQTNVAPAINIADTGLASQNVNAPDPSAVAIPNQPTTFNSSMENRPEFGRDIAAIGKGLMDMANAGQSRIDNVNNINQGISNPDPTAGNGMFPLNNGIKEIQSKKELSNSASLFDRSNAETRHLASPYDNKTTADYIKELQTQKPSLNSNAIAASNEANMQLFRDSISGRKSPDVFQQSTPLSSQYQSQTTPVHIGTRPELPQFPASQQIQNEQLTTNSFQQSPSFKDAYGNNLSERKVYDESGRRLGGIGGGLALAEYEYKANMNLMRDIARKAALPDPIRNYTKEIMGYTDPNVVKGRGGKAAMVGGGSPIYQMVPPTGGSPSKNAAEALSAMGGFNAAGTVAGYHQGMASANKTNTDASLAPGLANASNTAHYASANLANANTEKTNVETKSLPENYQSDRDYKSALGQAALQKQNTDDSYAAKEKLAFIDAAAKNQSGKPFPEAYNEVVTTVRGPSSVQTEPTVADFRRIKAERDKKLKAAQGK